MSIPFIKMQALGNDFVLIDETEGLFSLSFSQRRQIADRHYGVGCDQLLIIQKTTDPAALFQYRVFNADGHEVEQCGNGACCIARYLLDNRKVDEVNNIFSLHCKAGLVQMKAAAHSEVAVNMGIPNFSPAAINLTLPEQKTYTLFIEDKDINFYAASIGNPHAVILVDKINEAELDEIGASLNNKTISPFQQGVNVGFMRTMNPNHIQLAIYERGVGRTLACGTGACAAVAAGQRAGLLNQTVQVTLPGGEALVYSEQDGSLWLQGDACSVFRGEIIKNKI